jgi:protein-S-isoprenylcysteine O-methyltransferase Ste14
VAIQLIITKLFFIIVIAVFIIGMSIPMVFISKKGMNPHGTHEGASILTRLTMITIFGWLIYVILFIIFDMSILYFWAFDFLMSDMLIIIGMILMVIGFIFNGLGELTLGTNFRVELPKEETELITSGIYRLMRNPIVFGVFLLLIGSFLIIPTVFSLIFLILNIITFDSKVRDEERFLEKRFGKEFIIYKTKVGRYLPFTLKGGK